MLSWDPVPVHRHKDNRDWTAGLQEKNAIHHESLTNAQNVCVWWISSVTRCVDQDFGRAVLPANTNKQAPENTSFSFFSLKLNDPVSQGQSTTVIFSDVVL